jgi:hypothetical protein
MSWATTIGRSFCVRSFGVATVVFYSGAGKPGQGSPPHSVDRVPVHVLVHLIIVNRVTVDERGLGASQVLGRRGRERVRHG